MRAGDLRHRVTLQHRTIVTDAYGEEIVTWASLATIWAAIWPVSGQEYFSQQADRRIGQVSHRVRIRYRKDVKFRPDRRFLFGNRVFEIRHVVDENERHRQLDCYCLERVLPGVAS